MVTKEQVEGWKSDEMGRLDTCLSQADEYQPPRDYFLSGRWSSMRVPSENSVSNWDTGIDTELFRFIAATSVKVPDDFVSLLLLVVLQ